MPSLGRRFWHVGCSIGQQELSMKTNPHFVRLISSVVGLSLGIGVATAGAILGVAALLH